MASPSLSTLAELSGVDGIGRETFFVDELLDDVEGLFSVRRHKWECDDGDILAGGRHDRLVYVVGYGRAIRMCNDGRRYVREDKQWMKAREL